MTTSTALLVEVPADLGEVTTIDRRAECSPSAVGMTGAGVDAIWSAVEALYRTGLHPALSLTVRRHGRVVIRRAIGHARLRDAEDAVPATPDTPICLFSASKAITAMLIHKVVELGELKLDDPVARYVPDYAQNNKGATTIRHLLAHRAGIPRAPLRRASSDVLCDWHGMIEALCHAHPRYRVGSSQAYHAITSGFILGEILCRVTHEDLAVLMHRWIAEPLGARTLTFGVPAHRRNLAARNYCTGSEHFFPLALLIKRILGVRLRQAIEISNDDDFLSAVVPAGNMFATADEASLFFQMMLNGGTMGNRRLFRTETIAEAVRPYGEIEFDRTLFAPLRFSAGMVLGERPFGLYGPNCPRAFGHLGFMNCLSWADPDRDIAVGFLNTGKSISPRGLMPLVRFLNTIGKHCPRLEGAHKPGAYGKPAPRPWTEGLPT